MGRRIAACAVLMALMISLSACKCARGTTTASTSKATPAKAADGKVAASGGTICVPVPCVRGHDCTACYQSEADKHMDRLKDDLPPGGCCKCPDTQHGHTVYHDPCEPCGK